MHPLYVHPDDRSALYRLLGTAWPRIARRIEIAAGFGWRWEDVTTPFVSLAEGRPVSHVGVLDLATRLGGRDVHIAGVHAVCTDPAHRRRGHYRAAMEKALAFIDARWPTAKLHTDRSSPGMPDSAWA